MGIFVFPPHAKIPLHDHPGMCVISRVLYGDLQRLSLDLPRCGGAGAAARKKSAPHGMCSWMSWSHSWAGGKQQQQSRRLAYKKKNAVDYLSAPDCTVLYPFEGNLHEFVAGPEGAAVLDVLLPPYDTEHHRDCTFYQLHDYDLKDNIFSAINSSSDDHRSVTESGEPCWIIPTGQPEDFHCLSGKYRELGG